MKRIIILLIMAFIAPTLAYAKLPVGYKNAKWGMAMKEVKNTVTDGNINREYDGLCVTYSDDNAITSVYYSFDKGRLYNVRVDLNLGPIAALSEKEHTKAAINTVKTLINKYGNPIANRKYSPSDLYGDNAYITLWRDSNTEILYMDYFNSGAGIWMDFIKYSSKKIQNEIDAREKQINNNMNNNTQNNLKNNL